jgi:hypothetical protein
MKQIPLTQGKVALVDDEDYERVAALKWQAKKSKGRWYAQMSIWKDGRLHTRAMHRFILGTEPGKQVDHEDQDGLNNQRYNLRECGNAGNSQNRGLNKRNTSGFKGVSYRPDRGRWIAFISVDSKKKYLGLFDEKIKAALAYDAAAIVQYGEFARLNFPVQP